MGFMFYIYALMTAVNLIGISTSGIPSNLIASAFFVFWGSFVLGVKIQKKLGLE